MSSIVSLYASGMETRLFEYFVAVADERNITAASVRVFAAQSTVSAGLKSLERDLGVRLFERTSKSVTLTPAGESLLPAARAILDRLDEARLLATETQTGLRGRVRFGTFTGLRTLDLPRILGEFRRSHPLVDIRVSASPTGSAGLADDLARDRLDLALTALPPAPGTPTWRLGSFPFVALVGASHPLAQRPGVRVSLEDLAGEDWVEVLAGYGNRVQLDAELARRGIGRRIAAELGDLSSVPHYVAAGFGVAVIPDIVETEGCTVLTLEAAMPPWILSIAANRQAVHRPHVRALLDAITG